MDYFKNYQHKYVRTNQELFTKPENIWKLMQDILMILFPL
jgi:hypothetical protein